MNRKEGLFRTFAIIRENLEKYCSRKTAEILKNCTISQQTRQFLFEMLEKTVKKLRKSDFNALLAENCAVEKEKYRFLKNRVKTAVSCGKTQEKGKVFENIEGFLTVFKSLKRFSRVYTRWTRSFSRFFGFWDDYLRKSLRKTCSETRILRNFSKVIENFRFFIEKSLEIKEFVRLKRFETFTVEEIMASMNVLFSQYLSLFYQYLSLFYQYFSLFSQYFSLFLI